jgi:hypothetical protein
MKECRNPTINIESLDKENLTPFYPHIKYILLQKSHISFRVPKRLGSLSLIMTWGINKNIPTNKFTQTIVHFKLLWNPCSFHPFLIINVATSLWPSVKMKLTLPKLGTWSPPGLPKTQSLISGVKTPRIGVFLISLERSWSVDVQNGLAWVIWTYVAQVMGKRRAGSQIGNLIPNHKKSGIHPIPTCDGEVQHNIRNLLRRTTRLVQTSSRLEVGARSYDGPKSRESKPGQFQDSTLGVPGQKATWAWAQWSNAENTIWGKVVASPEFGPWWLKWVQGCPWLVPTPKGCRMSSNQLVVGFGCRTV